MELFSEYYKKDSLLLRTDARVKLFVALIVLAMVLSYKGFALPLLVTLLCIVSCVMMRIPARVVIIRFAEPAFIVSIILLLKFFFSGNDVLFSFSILGVKIAGHMDGLREGLLIACRIAGAVSVVALLGFATPFTEIIAGLSWLKFPKGFIEILMFAYRYIFMLFEDAMVIYNAQKNRLGYSNLRRGLNSFGILAGSLTIKAFEHSQNTTVAMVQRGYDGNMPVLKHKPFKPAELIASVLVIFIMGVVWKI